MHPWCGSSAKSSINKEGLNLEIMIEVMKRRKNGEFRPSPDGRWNRSAYAAALGSDALGSDGFCAAGGVVDGRPAWRSSSETR